MAKGEKTNLYLLSIVAIVAIVGIVVLILNSGAGSVSLSDDLSGEAFKVSKMSDCKTGTVMNAQGDCVSVFAGTKGAEIKGTTTGLDSGEEVPCDGKGDHMCGEECCSPNQECTSDKGCQ